MKTSLWIILISTLFFRLEGISQQTSDTKAKNNTTLHAAVANKSKGDITKNELLSVNEIQLMNNIDSLYHIISFNLWIACPGWDPHECKSNSNQITECMKNGFMKLRYNGGCRVYFDKIMCVGKNNDTLELSALSFKTKELILKNK